MVTAIKDLIDTFKIDRYIFLFLSIFSFLFLMVCAVILLVSDESKFAYVLGMFGSSGVIAYTANRILVFWKDCISLLKNYTNTTSDER